jgi:hypothetical protein
MGFVAELQQFDPTPAPSAATDGSASPADPQAEAAPDQPEPADGAPTAFDEPTDDFAVLGAPQFPTALDEPTDPYRVLADRRFARPEDPQPTDLYAALAVPDFAAVSVPVQRFGGVADLVRTAGSIRPDLVLAGYGGPDLVRPGVVRPDLMRPGVGGTPIDITPGVVRTATGPSGGDRRRRLGVLVMTGTGLAALVAGGVGYAALAEPATHTATAPEHSASAPGSPFADDATVGAPAAPGADRAKDSPSPPVGAAPPVATTTAGPTAPTRAVVTTPPAGGSGGGTAGRPTPAPGHSTPTRPASPENTAAPHNPPPVVPPGPSGTPSGQGYRPLLATLNHTADLVGDGLLQYSGTVNVDNPARRAAGGWQVTLLIPGGNQVSAYGAVVAQDGEYATFTPYAGAVAVPPGGTVTFTFVVHGVLPTEPWNCTIDGRPCY